MITKEQIEHVFNIIEYENTYLLFLKTDTEKRELLATISADTFQIKKHHNNFIEPKPDSIEMLCKQINDYMLSLELYNIDLVEFDLLTYQIDCYMNELGFKWNAVDSLQRITYIYTLKVGYEKIHYEICFDNRNTELTHILKLKFYVLNDKGEVFDYCDEFEVNNSFDDIKNGISFILKDLFSKGIEIIQTCNLSQMQLIETINRTCKFTIN